ncbi:unnamed protein product [Cylicostephanus goldi]|uniref:Uncharacterized protein n=1 Tax=Cylicostephanus goldi TaxID=71465 RepID=A0A3P6T6R7_CYLGO|nr:unnamed protein product [Cylicostephanus goldi]
MGDYEDTDVQLVQAFRISEVPERLHWAGSSDPLKEAKQTSGWDPEAAQMRGIFMARGPGFKVDEKVGPVEIVDVYQVILNILSVDSAHPHNGTWSNVADMLSSGWENRANSDKFNEATRFGLTALPLILLMYRFLP